jgi:predicted small metal-binding protein
MAAPPSRGWWEEELMEKQIACGDVVHGCKAVFTAPTQEELLKKVIAHAEEVHGIKEVSPEMAAQVTEAIRDFA